MVRPTHTCLQDLSSSEGLTSPPRFATPWRQPPAAEPADALRRPSGGTVAHSRPAHVPYLSGFEKCVRCVWWTRTGSAVFAHRLTPSMHARMASIREADGACKERGALGGGGTDSDEMCHSERLGGRLHARPTRRRHEHIMRNALVGDRAAETKKGVEKDMQHTHIHTWRCSTTADAACIRPQKARAHCATLPLVLRSRSLA